jgi:Zn-dependent protease with chaperone function
MSESVIYPSSPEGIPSDLTKAKSSYRRQALLAMLGLTCFMAVYVGLAICFGLITFNTVTEIMDHKFDLFKALIAASSALLTVFMAKSLFTIQKSGNPGGIEVSESDEPELFSFLYKLSDEIGAPRPHRVFITPDVNAAVFYDLSLLNLIFPTKKNLIIGLGLVNVLNMGELKAVLAHEFGHFAQGSLMVGRWVYIAQQIIGHMVATRDWLDKVVQFISRVDIRVAWVGWILGLIIWSIRSLMDTLFSLVVIAERALSREMEFNADLVAVSVTGSDALINALYKLQAADDAWQTALNVATSEVKAGNVLKDLFAAQKTAINEVGRILGDDEYGKTPSCPEGLEISEHRVFTEQMARPPQMWSTHPHNRDREINAKNIYIAAEIDEREAWLIFSDAESLRENISLSFVRSDPDTELQETSSSEAIINNFDHEIYNSKYRGTYLNRNWVRNFESIDEILSTGKTSADLKEAVANLYPESISTQLEVARNLDMERNSLEALASGDLKPSGGVIRHRGNELKKADIPGAIEEIAQERKEIGQQLKEHDASCRTAYINISKSWNNGWDQHLTSLTHLLHCSSHLKAVVENEMSFLSNTWQVITADGQVGYFEKRRVVNVCKNVHGKMKTVIEAAQQIVLSEGLLERTGIDNWSDQCPKFELLEVTKGNWQDWCSVAFEEMGNLSYALGILQNAALNELIKSEKTVEENMMADSTPEAIVNWTQSPTSYPLLVPGNEHVLQRKLDLWNRFQLAHGFGPTVMRLLVASGIVGGTIAAGFIGV